MNSARRLQTMVAVLRHGSLDLRESRKFPPIDQWFPGCWIRIHPHGTYSVSSPLDELTMEPSAPRFADIEDASRRISAIVPETPLLESELLNTRLGGRVLIKAECLQRTGSFKFRGAWNRLSLIPETCRGNGVVAYSSGNHAQGVAASARLLGIPATIIMPKDAPEVKKRSTRAYGATVIEYDRHNENREQIGMDYAGRTGATLVKPYDDPMVIAGQGSVGLEVSSQLAGLGLMPDQLICPCGGGGLISGISIALHENFPQCRIFCAEPEYFDDTARSLEAGHRVSNVPGRSSICDAIVTPEPGELTFPINLAHLAGGLTASDEEVLQAMRTAFSYFRIVLEPGGAVALAVALSGRIALEDRCTVVVCSGGNVDAGQFRKCLEP
jgi:threonine dehydratase